MTDAQIDTYVAKIVAEDRYDWVEDLTYSRYDDETKRTIYRRAMVAFGWTFNEDTGRWQ
jgi:hypothetical protein